MRQRLKGWLGIAVAGLGAQGFAAAPAPAPAPVPAAYTCAGQVEAWRNLGAVDFSYLLKMAATPRGREDWLAAAGDFPGDRLHASAFFSSAWTFLYAPEGKLRAVGFYQPWIDVLMLIRVGEVEGDSLVTALSLSGPATAAAAPVIPATPAAMSGELTDRLRRAEGVFREAALKPAAEVWKMDAAGAARALAALNGHVETMRARLAPEGDRKGAAVRKAVTAWMEEARAGRVKGIPGAADPKTAAWLGQLAPVELVQAGTNEWLLAMAAYRRPERVLLARLQVSADKTEAKELTVWDAATAQEAP